MAQRAIVHGMHETDIIAAEGVLPAVEVKTESYVISTIDDEQEKKLKELGLFVEYIPEGGDELQENVSAERKNLRIQTLSAGRAQDPTLVSQYLVEWKRPILEDDLKKFATDGIKITEAIGRNVYLASLTEKQQQALQAYDGFARIEDYFSKSLNEGIIRRSVTPEAPRQLITYDIRTNKESTESVSQWLKENRISIAGKSARKVRIYLTEDDPIMDQISALDGVISVEEYVYPKIRNDRARVILGVDAPQTANTGSLKQTGKGQIVGVADTGIDDTHKDFKNRLIAPKGWGRANLADDPDGHGTHVSGSIIGDGAQSNGAYKGIAPEAKLYMQSLLDAQGGLGGLPLDLNDLYQDAYDQGCRIHNNSWGASTKSKYVGTSLEVDEFAHRNQDFLIVFAAGNEGQAANRTNSQVGFVDWLSVNSPGSAKNCICVGASRSDRITGGLSQRTWKSGWPGKFPDKPIGDDHISGDPECLAGFSSRGPSDDRRILPHVVAPGTDIVSTKSSLAPVTHYWAPHENSEYAYDGGTSMASPIVTGCATLIRQYLVEDRGIAVPSAALIKAIIVNSTDVLSGQDALADHKFVPNFHQGFGRINMQKAIPSDPERLLIYDTYPNGGLRYSGDKIRFNFYVQDNAVSELRICLCWPDPPGRALQNQMNLFLQEPSNKRRTGNERLPMSLNIPDPDNNTQIIRVPQPSQGQYLLQVTATNLLKPPQNFALVVYGDLTPQGLVSA